MAQLLLQYFIRFTVEFHQSFSCEVNSMDGYFRNHVWLLRNSSLEFFLNLHNDHFLFVDEIGLFLNFLQENLLRFVDLLHRKLYERLHLLYNLLPLVIWDYHWRQSIRLI